MGSFPRERDWEAGGEQRGVGGAGVDDTRDFLCWTRRFPAELGETMSSPETGRKKKPLFKVMVRV